MDKLVSIIVPVYNSAKYLDKCIHSLANQSYHNIEIILINDGSTDTSPSLCETWSEKDARVIVIHKDNAGVSAARNDGIARSSGEYIMFVDSDDYLSENAVRTAMNLLDDDVDLVTMSLKQIDVNGNVLLTDQCKDFKIDTTDFRSDIWSYRKYLSYIYNRIYRAEIIKLRKIQFDEKLVYCEDTAFVIGYLAHCKKIVFPSEISYYYLRYPEQTIARYIPNHFEQALFAHREIRRFANKESSALSEKECELLFALFFNAILNLFFTKLKFQFRTNCIKKYLSEPDIITSINSVKHKKSSTLYEKAENVYINIAKTRNPFLLYIAAKFFVFLRSKILGKS